MYIEPEDLLHALIREDRGEFPAISTKTFPGLQHPASSQPVTSRPFFSDGVARTLLRELHEDPDPLSRETPEEKRKPAPHVDMPVSSSLSEVLAWVANVHHEGTGTIEPLDLLAGLVENRDSRLAQLLRDCGITRQNVANALDSGSQ